MKVRKALLVLGILLSLTGLASGALASKIDLDVSIGTQMFQYTYDKPGYMEHKGWLSGISYSIAYKPIVHNRRWLVKLDGIVATGQVDYSSENTGSMDDQENFMTDTRALFGYSEHHPSKQMSVTLFSGLAYRYLSNESENRTTTTGSTLYDRHTYYYYSPIGGSITINEQENWALQATLEYDLFWSGIHESKLGYLAGYDDRTYDQNTGYGYRLSLAFQRKITSYCRVSIEPFFRLWDIKDSEKLMLTSVNYAFEPANKTSEFGLNISLLF